MAFFIVGRTKILTMVDFLSKIEALALRGLK
jgi:hypothetical protein